MLLEDFEIRVKQLQDVEKIQSSDGNWNSSEYMWGMANGLKLARAILEFGPPNYFEKPDHFLNDLPKLIKLVKEIDYLQIAKDVCGDK